MASAAEVAASDANHGSRRYEVRERLALGGMGAIHRAYDKLAQREVAYKRLVVEDERSRVRLTVLFQREYETLARLPHPNIVEVYDYGRDAHGPYYAMELLTGSDLTSLAPLGYREACRVIRDVASALALVHARRLLHRDVSPNNVRLTSSGHAKLIDFGTLAPFGPPRELVGTPAFIAPEALAGEALDQRSDLYSLGAVAYWALTKRLVVNARSIEELIERLDEPVVRPSEYAADIPTELDALVMSLIAREPVARPSSAASLIDKLTAFADLAPERDEARVAFSYLAHPPLSGRDDTLRTLEHAIEESANGHGQSVLLEGGARLGRSALLEAAVLHAQLTGAVVLRAQGDRSGPFGVARKLSQQAAVLYPEVQATSEARRSFFAKSPNAVQPAPSPVAAADHHALLLDAVQRALLEISRRSPLLIAIDDLHAADAESLALLASLSHEITRHPITLVATTLSGDPRSNDSAVAKLRAASQRVVLSALDEAHTLELVESIFGGVPNTHRLAQWLHTRSGGVPGQALDLARLLLRSGLVRYALGTFTLPHDVDAKLETVNLSSAALARIAGLEQSSQTIARLLCLHAGVLQIDELSAASGLAAREVLFALEELASLGVVEHGDEGFSLYGESLREALKTTIADAEQKRLHLALGRALSLHSAGSLDAQLAASEHLIEGGDESEQALAPVSAICSGNAAARWVTTIERTLAIYRRQGRSEEECLRLLMALVYAGFYGEIDAQRRHIDQTLALMARICGMTLALKLRRFCGGTLALIVGLSYAALRRAFTPPAQRLNTLPGMIAEFVGLVVGGAAAAASAMDSGAAARYVAWLDPLSALPKHSSGYLMREYCFAIAETSAGDFSAASARYATLIPTFAQPVRGLDDNLREAIYLGALNGRAQAEVSNVTPKTLELADELGRGDPFYAPHAECARMAYYGHRGERDKAEVHRARAELLALRGGTSWSAVTVLTVRLAYSAMLTRDAIELMRAIAELERMRAIAPKLGTCQALCEAWLEYLRGRPESAVALFERVIDTSDARALASWRVDRALYATVLNAAGQHERAKAVCLAQIALLQGAPDQSGFSQMHVEQLAIAEAQLGDLASATARLDALLVSAERLGNPLELGLFHRDRAQLALLARDHAAFDQHYAAMERHFQATRNPALMHYGSLLLADAARAGLRVAEVPAVAQEDELDASTMLIRSS